MLQIEKLIRSLPDDDFNRLKQSFLETRATKFHDLLICYRGDCNEEKFKSEKNLTKNAFNVLKSRLYEKIQNFLLNKEIAVDKNFLLQVFNIPNLVYSTDREIAMTILEGIEREFRQHNLFQLLSSVYQAQKKLSIGNPRYYHFSKLYNDNITFCLSQDKADDELSKFNQVLAKYYHSRDINLLLQLKIHKSELEQQNRLNESSRIKLYRIFLNCSARLCAPELEIHDDISIDEQLKNAQDIIDNNEDEHNDHFNKAVQYFYFLYYTELALTRDATNALKKSFDLKEYRYYYPLVCIAPYADYRLSIFNPVRTKNDQTFDSEELSQTQLQDHNEVMSFISEKKHDSILLFVNDDYQNSLQCLREVLNTISFKPYPFSEIEVKLLYLIISIIAEKDLNQESTLLSVVRKIKELTNHSEESDHLAILIKLIRLRMKEQKTKLEQAGPEMLKNIRIRNKGRFRILPQLINDPLLNSFIIR